MTTHLDPLVFMALISGIMAGIVLIIGWEVAGRWAYLSSRTVHRLKDTDTVAFIEGLAGLPKNSLAHKLLEANQRLTVTQFRLLMIGLGVGGTLLAWAFFIPGLPALAIGGILAYLPLAYVNDRAKSRGRTIDAKLPLALSRMATGLQANHGLSEVLERTAESLLSEGPNPLSPELVKTARDIHVKDTEEALRDLSRRSASLSLANVAMLLVSYHRAGGGQYADVVSETALAIQSIIAVRNHASAKSSQPLQAAKIIPLILGFVLFVMMSDPVTRASFRLPLAQIVMAIAMGFMILGYRVMREEVLKVV